MLRSTDVRTRDGHPVRERVVTARRDRDHTDHAHHAHHAHDADHTHDAGGGRAG
jgi:hypothetical protein